MSHPRTRLRSQRTDDTVAAAAAETSAPTSAFDPHAFPHIVDQIIDHLYQFRDVETLRSLRLVSSFVRDAVDNRSDHLVVRPQGIHSRLSGITRDWSHARPRVVDFYCGVKALEVEDENTVRHIIGSPSSRVEVVRVFDQLPSIRIPRVRPSATIVQFGSEFGFGLDFVLTHNVRREILRINYSSAHGLPNAVKIRGPACLNDIISNDILEVVLLCVPSERKEPYRPLFSRHDIDPISEQQELSRILLQNAFDLMRDRPKIRFLVVGTESWDMKGYPWCGQEDVTTVAQVWDYYVDHNTYNIPSGAKDLISFMGLQEFQTQDPELYRLCIEK